MKLRGKTLLVTGAGSGLGEALALELGRRGATVACVDRDQGMLARVVERLEAATARCSGHLADVSDGDAVARLVAEVDQRHAGFDGLINNAGIMQAFRPISALEIGDIERIQRVNYWGMVMLVKASLPILEGRPTGLIVNVSSLGGLVPFPGQTAYSASKAAVRVFSEGLGMELEERGIQVAAVMPGAMRTGIVANSPFYSRQQKAELQESMRGRGFALDPDRAARRILTAVEKGRRRIVLGKDAWLVDKLYRIAPVTTGRLLRGVSRFLPAIE